MRRSCSSKRMEAATGYDLQVEVAAMEPRRHLFPRSLKYRSIHFKHSIHKGFTATFVLVVFMSPISTASLSMSSISERVDCFCAWATCTCTVDAAAGMHIIIIIIIISVGRERGMTLICIY